jgi:hypothetical protein
MMARQTPTSYIAAAPGILAWPAKAALPLLQQMRVLPFLIVVSGGERH